MNLIRARMSARGGTRAARPPLRARSAVVVADQVDQGDRARRRSRASRRSTLFPGIKLINTRNTGVAFSMFSGGGPLVVIVALSRWARCWRSSSRTCTGALVWLPTGLLLGGAAGNLIDRVRRGAVTDFVKFPHWPAFNVADICDHVRRAVADLRARDARHE